MNISKKKKTLYFSIVMIVITTITYLNHFNNSFHFDDIHTITENPNIRDLKNIPSFFKDGTTISSLAQNQTYRPVVTTSLAFDYWLGNGYNVFYFHLTSFILFLLQGILIFLFVHRILNLSLDNTYNFYVASGITLWYMIHPVMAETINYIIARSDLQSTFFVVLAFVIYQYSSIAKKYYLYLIPVAIGALAKPTAIMFAPLFLSYVLLFEEKVNFFTLFSSKSFNKTVRAIVKSIPSIIFCTLLYIFHHMMTPDTFTTGSSETFNYLITQPFVIFHYFTSIFLPTNLSADTDWKALQTIWSYQYFIGLLFLSIAVYIIWITSRKEKHHPICFGLLWFFIALAPTSSLIPLAEVMNDHRMFFPYIGLALSVGWSFNLFLQYLRNKYHFRSSYLIIPILTILPIYAFATYLRNEVWDNDQSLWKDVTIKSPKNPRGLMNYGIIKMEAGEHDIAEEYFKKSLKIAPDYPFLHINLGVLNNIKGNSLIAEEYFKKAIEYGGNYYHSWFHYGKFLWEKSRNEESIDKLSKSLKLSPSNIEIRMLLMENYLKLEDWKNLNTIASSTLEMDKNNKRVQYFLLASVEKNGVLDMEEKEIINNPTPEKYFTLSFKYYQKKQYLKSISIAEKAIALNPNYAEAYNNICSAYNILGNYDKAIEACKKAIQLAPNYQLAKNNLDDILNRKNKIEYQIELLKKDNSEANYLNLSVLYYNNGLFERCIKVAEEGIIQHPNSDKLYNNICSGYNALKKWDKAIEAGKKGLTLNPDNQLLKNNFEVALKNIQQ
ncbi:tetratricopeptide repeat protein [Aquimarina algiphila]|uniref:tetratricopeptide repeat protein n=1 Tax=Aquimarina algiphila TaxID=2047982 RepID=UPI0023313CCE|nr:tetratricopeptide repeat protein [Aquimarina algiphila]